MSTLANAVLAADSYRYENDRQPNEPIDADDRQYAVIRTFNDPSGYQGVLYQDQVTGDLVLAHRGTEFGRQPVRDGVLTDLGMVLTGFSAQVPAALRATEAALAYAQDKARDCGPLDLALTGHSLGGLLAQYTGHRYGLHAETFDAYGAADLVADLGPDVGHIVNHVRATDFVSAASRHVGEVRIYAAEADVAALQQHGYANNERRVADLRNPVGVMIAMGAQAHYSRNFLPDNDLGIGGSIISADNQQRYLQYQPMVDKFGKDVATFHDVLSLPRNAIDAVADHVRHAISGRPLQREAAGLRVNTCPQPLATIDVRTMPVEERFWGDLNSPLYRSIATGMEALEAGLGRSPDEATRRVVAGLYAQSRQAGLERADQVLMGGPTSDPMFFVVQGYSTDPAHQRIQLRAAEALATPVEKSLEQAGHQNGQAVPGFTPPDPGEVLVQVAVAR